MLKGISWQIDFLTWIQGHLLQITGSLELRILTTYKMKHETELQQLSKEAGATLAMIVMGWVFNEVTKVIT